MRLLRAAIAIAAPLVLSSPAAGEWSLTLRPGTSWVADDDLRLVRPGGTDVTLRSVAWNDESTSAPIYYGVALTWWSSRARGWGLGIDYTHAKAILDTEQRALVQGTLAGQPIDEPRRVGDMVPSFQLTHGLNLLTATAYRRWEARRRPDAYAMGDERPGVALYLGLGAGFAVPHVEAAVDGVETSGFQLAGPAARALVGLDVPVEEKLSLVGEAILSWADVRADLAGGGRLSARFLVPQLALGIALRP